MRAGHRERLRQRYLSGGPRAFLDHEILEMLLAQVDRRADTKARAYSLIEALAPPSAFATRASRPLLGAQLAPVVLADPEKLRALGVKGVGPSASVHLSGVRSASARIAATAIMDMPVLGNWEAAVSYSKLTFSNAPPESVHVLYLDYRHRLLARPGTFARPEDPQPFCRHVVQTALRRGASGLILVRNEGSSPAIPAKRDFTLTEQLKAAAGHNNILLHDYMCLSDFGDISLRNMGMLELAEAYRPAPLLEPKAPPKPAEGHTPNHGSTLYELQQSALTFGADSLTDRELLILMLRHIAGDPAKAAISDFLCNEFPSLGRIAELPVEELANTIEDAALPEVSASPEALAVHLGIVFEAVRRTLRGVLVTRTLGHDLQALVNYCRASTGYSDVELFRVLFIRGGQVYWDEVMVTGTVNKAPVQPREVAARALRLKADSIILVHNHPTGDPTPSLADIDMTDQLINACSAVGVAIDDHLIVSPAGYTSLVQSGDMPGLRPKKTRSAGRTKRFA